MTQNTVNYGFRIPSADGSDNIVVDDLRLPITAIDTKIKDRANEIAATNTTVAGHTTSINANTAAISAINTGAAAAGLWTNFTGEVRTDAGVTPAAGTAVQQSRWMRIGKTVWVYYEATMSAIVTSCSIMLPTAAGVPRIRNLMAGQMYIFDPGGAPVQTSVARMTTAKDRVLGVTGTNAFVDASAGSSLQALLMYEVN